MERRGEDKECRKEEGGGNEGISEGEMRGVEVSGAR